VAASVCWIETLGERWSCTVGSVGVFLVLREDEEIIAQMLTTPKAHIKWSFHLQTVFQMQAMSNMLWRGKNDTLYVLWIGSNFTKLL